MPAFTQITESTIVRRSSNHFTAEHEGATVIMSVEAGKFFTFDPIGFEIWEAFAISRKVADVAEELAERHNAPREVVAGDITTFLARLADEELLDFG